MNLPFVLLALFLPFSESQVYSADSTSSSSPPELRRDSTPDIASPDEISEFERLVAGNRQIPPEATLLDKAIIMRRSDIINWINASRRNSASTLNESKAVRNKIKSI